MSESMRGFVCLPIPPQARQLLGEFQDKMRDVLPDYRFTAEANLHITLQFLGDVPGTTPGRIATALSSSIGEAEPFFVSSCGADSMPQRGTPRILYVYITSGHKELTALAGKVRGALGSLGYVADKPFLAHITMGRRRDTRRPSTGADTRSLWVREFQGFTSTEGTRDALSWKVDTVLVMESVLGRGGPTYTPRATVVFG